MKYVRFNVKQSSLGKVRSRRKASLHKNMIRLLAQLHGILDEQCGLRLAIIWLGDWFRWLSSCLCDSG